MDEYLTDDNPFQSDDQTKAHLHRALELIQQSGEPDMRTMYDVYAHLQVASVRSTLGDEV